MNDLAELHRRIADVVEPLEEMGIEATVDERTTEDGDLYLSLDLRIPPTLESIDPADEAGAQVDALETKCERLRDQWDDLQDEVDGIEADLASVRSTLGEGDDASAERRDPERHERPEPTDTSAKAKEIDSSEEEIPVGAGSDLTDGERETLQALRALGEFRESNEIADEVDATLQSVQSWLPKLVQAGHIRTRPDPADGRRKLYAAAEPDEDTDDEDTEDVTGTVYIASAGGSPSQVFHVREDCPQLQKSTDCVEKDRSVVPHHRPCGNCVPDGLEEGIVALAKGSSTTTYHEREDCPKLGSANNVTIQGRETVPNHDPCDDCAHSDGEQSSDENRAKTGDTNGHQATGKGDDVPGEETVARDDAEIREPPDAAERERSGDEEDETADADQIDDTDGEVTDDEHVPEDGDVARRSDDAEIAEICRQNDLRREEIVDALETATAVYHVQRDLTLSSDATEALLRGLGLFESLDGGGRVSTDSARSAVRKHVPSAIPVGSENGGTRE